MFLPRRLLTLPSAVVAFLCLVFACGNDDEPRQKETVFTDVPLGQQTQGTQCRSPVAAINVLACDPAASSPCGHASLRCRPHTRLCMPNEDALVACNYGADQPDQRCGHQIQCRAGQRHKKYQEERADWHGHP